MCKILGSLLYNIRSRLIVAIQMRGYFVNFVDYSHESCVRDDHGGSGQPTRAGAVLPHPRNIYRGMASSTPQTASACTSRLFPSSPRPINQIRSLDAARFRCDGHRRGRPCKWNSDDGHLLHRYESSECRRGRTGVGQDRRTGESPHASRL